MKSYLFPAIDLRGGRVVRLTQGDYDRETRYAADPVEQATAFFEAGATWLHVVDLDGARNGEQPNLPVIESICKALPNLKVEVGGGVRTETSVRRLLDAGVNRAIVGTAALKDWAWFEDLACAKQLASQLVLGLDARNGYVAASGWEEQTDIRAIDLAAKVEGWGLSGIVYTDIAMDGTLKGPNYEQTRQMADATDAPIVASGGVGTLEHLVKLRDLTLQGAIVGKALYENCFDIHQALTAYEGAK